MSEPWRCEMHHLTTNGDCPRCDDEMVALAPEATDPTPGEVGLSDFQQLGSEIHRFRCTNPDCRHYSDQGYFTPRDNDAASAILASDWLAARTADLRAEHAAEVAEVGAYARAMETIRDLRSSNARHAQAHAQTTRELRAAEAREAELRATVGRVAALADEYICVADAYVNSHLVQRALDLRRHAGDLRAALTTPPTTEGGK